MARNIFQKIREGVLGLFGRKKEEAPQPLTLEEPGVPDAESRWTEEYEEFLEGEEGVVSRQSPGEEAAAAGEAGEAEDGGPASWSGDVLPPAEEEAPGPEMDEWEED